MLPPPPLLAGGLGTLTQKGSITSMRYAHVCTVFYTQFNEENINLMLSTIIESSITPAAFQALLAIPSLVSCPLILIL